MKQTAIFSLLVSLFFLTEGCGSSQKDNTANLNDLRVKLEKEKKAKDEKDAEVKKLEDRILLLDSNAANAAKARLVSVIPATKQAFTHYIDLQARISAENISYISPRGMGGQVKGLYVKEGQFVKKGQLVVKLDDAIVRQQILAAQKGLEGIKTQLGFAKNIYQRQKNLWDQGIGTEVQVITTKTNVESLENQLHASEENVKVAQEQLKTTLVYSDVSGIANTVAVKLGEMFQSGQIIIVNNNELKATTDIPENYISYVHQGSKVTVELKDKNKVYPTLTISLDSQTINANTRGFTAECKLPPGSGAKPNQSALMRILDYEAANAVVIPVNLVQTDEAGKYVYVLVTSSNAKKTAHKIPVQVGNVYGDRVEIKAGLQGGEQLISEGYQGVYEGQLLTTELK